MHPTSETFIQIIRTCIHHISKTTRRAGRLWVWFGGTVCTAMGASIFLPDTMAGGLRVVSPLAYAWDLLSTPLDATEDLAILLAMYVCSLAYLILGLILAGWGGWGGLGGLGLRKGIFAELSNSVRYGVATCCDACASFVRRARAGSGAQTSVSESESPVQKNTHDATAVPLLYNRLDAEAGPLSPRLQHYQYY